MKVIFLHDVPRVGRKLEVKEVNDGYAMNFLLPRKLAEAATPKAVADLERRKKAIAIEREIQEELLLKNLEEIKGKTVTIKANADDKGHLFSAIRAKTIAEAMKSSHQADISEEFIALEKPVKEIGEFDIPILIKGKKSSFKLIVERI